MAFSINSPTPTLMSCLAGDAIFFEYQSILDNVVEDFAQRSFTFACYADDRTAIGTTHLGALAQTDTGNVFRWKLAGTFTEPLYNAGSINWDLTELLDDSTDTVAQGKLVIGISAPLSLKPDNNAAPVSRFIVRITRKTDSTVGLDQHSFTVKVLPFAGTGGGQSQMQSWFSSADNSNLVALF